MEAADSSPAPSPPSSPRLTRSISSYRLRRVIGRGSCGVVYAASGPNGSDVAVKVLPKPTKEADSSDEWAMTEADVLHSMKHPNIIPVIDSIETETEQRLVMPLCRGGDLLRYLRDNGPLFESQAKKVTRQLLGALAYIHKSGYIHGDIKLENVLLPREDDLSSLYLCDFGYARRWEAGRWQRRYSGSLHYNAPEVCTRANTEGPSTDIWGLGVVIFALMTGRLPFLALSAEGIAEKITSLEYKIPASVPKACADLLRSIFVTDPEKRATIATIQESAWLEERKAGSHTANTSQ